jgi:hypothetical protein
VIREPKKHSSRAGTLSTSDSKSWRRVPIFAFVPQVRRCLDRERRRDRASIQDQHVRWMLQGDLRGLAGADRRHSARKRCCIRHAHLAKRREMKPVGKRVVQVGNCMRRTELRGGGVRVFSRHASRQNHVSRKSEGRPYASPIGPKLEFSERSFLRSSVRCRRAAGHVTLKLGWDKVASAPAQLAARLDVDVRRLAAPPPACASRSLFVLVCGRRASQSCPALQ